MKNLSKAFFFFLMAAMIFASCEESNLDQVNITDPNFQPDETETNILLSTVANTTGTSLNLGCLSIELPFDLLLASGATITISTVSDFDNAVADDTDLVVDFVFPINTTDANGNAFVVNDINDLGIAFASCVPQVGWDTSTVVGNIVPAFLLQDICLDLIYPVSMEDGTGVVYTATNETEFINLIATSSQLYFSLPMDVLDDSGNVLTINDMDEFYNAAYNCSSINPPSAGTGVDTSGASCFDLLYPYDVLFDDGTLVTVSNDNDYANVVLNGGTIELQYPFSILDTNGNTVIVSNEGELILALQGCVDITITFPAEPCNNTPAHVLIFFNQSFCGYVDFPVQLVTADGIVHTINDMDDYYTVYNAYALDNIFFVYPFSVTESDGTVTSFNDEDEVCSFISDCE